MPYYLDRRDTKSLALQRKEEAETEWQKELERWKKLPPVKFAQIRLAKEKRYAYMMLGLRCR